MTKRCTKCKRFLLLSQYHVDNGHKDRLASQCKDCTRERCKKWQINNQSRHRELSRKYDHSEKGKQTKIKWRSNNRRVVLLTRKNNEHCRRLQERDGDGITNYQWDEILRKYNYRCAYCGIRGNMTIDHVVPLSKGGEHSIENIVPACAKCNCRKNAKLNWKPKIFRKVIGE